MAIKIHGDLRNTLCDAIVDAIDVGTPNGYGQFRTGSAPTNPEDASTGTLLAQFTFGATAFGAAASGTATANAITGEDSILANGTAGYGRIFDGNDKCLLQGTCGVGSGDFQFSPTNVLVATGTLDVDSMTVTIPQQGP